MCSGAFSYSQLVMQDTPLELDKGFVLRTAVGIARLMRRYGGNRGRKLLSTLRGRAALGILTKSHKQFAHAVRDFSLRGDEWFNPKVMGPAAEKVCNACQSLMADLLEIRDEDKWIIHCTLKLLLEEHGTFSVATLGRSDYRGDRPLECGLDKRHPLNKNSAFAAVVAGDDGGKRWEFRRAFACNDLPSKGHEFKCTREEYDRHYRSTLVFPIRHQSPEDDTPTTEGFLTFDRPTCEGFPGLPDVFALDAHQYNVKVEESPLWQVGAHMADVLAAVIRLIPR